MFRDKGKLKWKSLKTTVLRRQKLAGRWDYPADDVDLTDRQTIQRTVALTGQPNINRKALARFLKRKINSLDKRMIVYHGSYHESHNDLDRDKVLADICEWIERHV